MKITHRAPRQLIRESLSQRDEKIAENDRAILQIVENIAYLANDFSEKYYDIGNLRRTTGLTSFLQKVEEVRRKIEQLRTLEG